MKPSLKLHSFSFAIATMIVFSFWTFISTINDLSPIIIVISGTIVSVGFYRLIASAIVLLIQKSVFIKKFFLGTHYLQGTWVGFYIGVSGNVRFLIERFEQDIDELTIRGKSYSENTTYHATWIATSVSIDVKRGIISYMYECLPINDQSNTNGIAIFNFKRKNQYSKATELNGFSADLHIGKRVRAMEIKICDECDYDEVIALNKAKELYEQYKERF